MYHAQFFGKSAISDDLIEACGDRAVIILDGRECLTTRKELAKTEAVKRGYLAYQLRKGASFTSCTNETGVIRVDVTAAAVKPARRVTLAQACAKYTQRYTCDHFPAWALQPCEGNGKFYAPQFVSDQEWYDHTHFPGEPGHIMGTQHGGSCDTRGMSWPLGQWLPKPFNQLTRAELDNLAEARVRDGNPDDVPKPVPVVADAPKPRTLRAVLADLKSLQGSIGDIDYDDYAELLETMASMLGERAPLRFDGHGLNLTGDDTLGMRLATLSPEFKPSGDRWEQAKPVLRAMMLLGVLQPTDRADGF